MPDDDHFGVWALAHGLSSRLDTTPWTRTAVEAAAAEAGMAKPGRIFDALLERGVIVEVRDVAEFARRYRMQSLMVGLGNTPDEPLRNGIGLPGLAPAVLVPLKTYELWEWGHLGNSLWHACEMLAEVGRETTPDDPDQSDPERILDRALDSLRTLVAHNVAYLDNARTPAA